MSDEYEFAVKQVPMDENMQAVAEKLRQDGWVLNPAEGKPFVTWSIMRKKGATGPTPEFTAFFESKMIVDDNKVFVRKPNGDLLDASGNKIDETKLQ